MQRSIFYLWTTFSSYMIGIGVYILILKYLGEPLTSSGISRLIFWTLPTYLCILLGLFLLIIVLLRSINKYTLWLQTLLFIAASLLPASVVPILSGAGVIFEASFLLSSEGLLFMTAFVTTAVLFSYGIWIALNHKGRRAYWIVTASLVLIMFIV
ncbi:hypothetical protein DFQ01_101401 [Paenibacillus cellulosilyticus]|uniref:Uncharacterized protein n=1 Tax=Paenibacillus cellulosilyticus TaxID=375489 RepID=A0A2V2Z0L6_9BACL|nr:hypothetical protein [Paenibacillus cellulosilyticus]PWW08675.1 hypothetical protein DFQ01_101401 [Paenibacillus cellulosilyticus]QKS48241.1 hypothetical protein HUB94_28625 [Paenibacillus cellulosilyticus]